MARTHETRNEGEPLSAAEFARSMDGFGPFERNPHIAVAVSGGRDSMALCLLAADWAKARGGRVSALTVDHRLRAESAQEAAQVGAWLRARGIDHHVLAWDAAKPASGVQAAARAARYDLMERWCRDAGVLHLFVAHHREDQAETVLLRLQRGSGLDGLAGMSRVIERADVRLLRPFLDMSRVRLTATLRARGQGWTDDPSNDDPVYARTRLRAQIHDEGDNGWSVDRLTALAARSARARIALESEAASLLARCCMLDPAGFARLDVTRLQAAPEEISLRVLARVLRCIGGRRHIVRLERLERLHAAVVTGGLGRGRTLGRCRISRDEAGEDAALLVCREHRHLPEPVRLVPGRPIHWDGRFRVAIDAQAARACGPLRLAPLGREGWRAAVAERPALDAVSVPAPARATLPALGDHRGLAFVPPLGYVREDLAAAGVDARNALFWPQNPLGDHGFVGFMLQVQRDILSL